MLRFQGTFLVALLGSVTARSEERSLSGGEHAPIAGFNPLTDVRDQNRIDLDQRLIMDLVEEGDFDAAQAVYEQGSFSKSVATITLTAGLPFDLEKGAQLHGVTYSGTSSQRQSTVYDVIVIANEAYPATNGTLDISVKYHTEGCFVGANPRPVWDGCLAPEGILSVPSIDDSVAIEYTYDPPTTTNNYMIQYFTQPTEFIFEEGGSYPELYQKFVTYYGSEAFYDDWIQAAIVGGKTSFANGNADFSAYSDEARAEAVQKATAYGAVWMYVFRELWHAIYLCNTHDCHEVDCYNEPAVHEVDEAVAFWTGSLEGTDGSGDGVLTYHLADKRCVQFSTCGENGDSTEGTSKVNFDAFAEFDILSQNIINGQCDEALTNTNRLIQIATIPLVQGAIKYAHATGVEQDTEDAVEAEGATFAFLVLPLVHACNPEDASTIYQNLQTGQKNSASYDAVKLAFENNYECLGITAADVGVVNELPSADSVSADGNSNFGSTSDSYGPNSSGPDATAGAGSFPTGAASGAIQFSTTIIASVAFLLAFAMI